MTITQLEDVDTSTGSLAWANAITIIAKEKVKGIDRYSQYVSSRIEEASENLQTMSHSSHTGWLERELGISAKANQILGMAKNNLIEMLELLAEDEVIEAAMVPDRHAPVDSPECFAAKTDYARTHIKGLNDISRLAASLLIDAEDGQAWKVMGYDCFEAWLALEIGISARAYQVLKASEEKDLTEFLGQVPATCRAISVYLNKPDGDGVNYFTCHSVYSAYEELTEQALINISERIDQEIRCEARVRGLLSIIGSDITPWIRQVGVQFSRKFTEELETIQEIVNEETDKHFTVE